MGILDMLKQAWDASAAPESADDVPAEGAEAPAPAKPTDPAPARPATEGLLDRLQDKVEDVRQDAAKRAAAAAARQSIEALGEKVRAVGDSVLDDAEKMLDEGTAARSGRTSVVPDQTQSDALAAHIQSAAQAASTSKARLDAPQLTPEQKAARELARLKAAMEARKAAGLTSDDETSE